MAPEASRRDDDARQNGTEVEESSGSCGSEERAPREMETRPQSAWNSGTGRRPRFTFSDVDERWRTSHATTTRREMSSSDSDSDIAMMTPVQPTSQRSTRRRASQIPVRADRLHPSTINHVEDRPRRHSLYDVADSHDTVVLDLVRGREAEVDSTSAFDNRRRSSREDSASGCQKPLSTSRSFPLGQQAASMRVLARLARTGEEPEPEIVTSSTTVGHRRPRKLDPIAAPSVVVNDVDRLRVDERSPTDAPEMEFDDATSGEIGRDDNCRLRPVVSRRAKALMTM